MGEKLHVKDPSSGLKKGDLTLRDREERSSALPRGSAGHVLQLQRAIGNQAVRRLVEGGRISTPVRKVEGAIASGAGDTRQRADEIEGRASSHTNHLKGEGCASPALVSRSPDGGVTGERERTASPRIDAAGATVNWLEPEEETDIVHGSVRGGGKYDPHMRPDGAYRFPDVTIEYDEGKQTWRIQAINIYSRVLVHKPDRGAFPVVGENVLNEKSLGKRTPRDDPRGRGYWRDVVKNLRLYKPGVDINELQWWVEAGTRFHELTHHESYKRWFHGVWGELRKKLAKELQRSLAEGETSPVTKGSLERSARSILQGLIEVADAEADVSTREDEAYEATRVKHWEPAAVGIKKEAKARGWD